MGEPTGLSPAERDALLALRAGEATRHSFDGLQGDSCCDLVIRETQSGTAVLVSECADNQGTSITSCIDRLATEIYHQFLSHLDPESIIWLEHYPADERMPARESVDRVDMRWDGKAYRDPDWSRAPMGSLVFNAEIIPFPA